jgi:poly(3-hydroxyalkanoate) synthetase
MHAATQSSNPNSNVLGVACGGLFSVAAAVEFARQRRGDCSTLITYVALRETGMLDEYMNQTARHER